MGGQVLFLALCIRRTQTLCIRQTLCRHVTIGTPMVIFCCLIVFDDWYTVGTLLVDMWRLVHHWSFLLFWLSFDCFWRLVHCSYTVGAVLVNMWQLANQWSFLLFWLFLTIGTLLVHGWYSLGRHVTIGTLLVQKQSKDSQNNKNDHRCTIHHRSTKTVPTVYQQCTNRQ